MDNKDEMISTFIDITQCKDLNQAQQICSSTSNLEEALMLYYSINDNDHNHQNLTNFEQHNFHTQPHPDNFDNFSNNSNSNLFNSQNLSVNEEIEMTDEEKRYLKNHKKKDKRIKAQEEKNSTFKKIWSYIRPAKTSGSEFVNSLSIKSSFELNFLKLDLGDCLKEFDLITKKELLVIFVQTKNVNLKFYLEQSILLNKNFAHLINENSAFMGIMEDNPDLIHLNSFDFKPSFVPCLLFLRRNIYDEIEMIKMYEFEKELTEIDPDNVIQVVQDVLSKFKETKKNDERFIQQTLAKKEKKKTQMQNRFFNTLPNPGVLFGNNSQSNIIHNFEDNPYQNYNSYNPEQNRNEDAHQNFLNEQNRLKLAEERELKKLQEEKYQSIINEKKKKEEELNQTLQKEEMIKNKKKEIKDKFENRKFVNDDLITFAIRLPNGKRIVQKFEQSEKTNEIYDFVFSIENKGFENENNNFEIFHNSFPPRIINKEEIIKNFFNSSDQEALNVKETFEDN
jgi:hypothetical protein